MKDKHRHGKKMVRNGRTKVIYKGTFISDRSLNIALNRQKLPNFVEIVEFFFLKSNNKGLENLYYYFK